MKTITFYSYKGGVGRTLAAVNFAVYLAKLGQKTVLVDFDLEAPGSDSKFSGFDLPKGQKGILDYILSYQEMGVVPRNILDFCVSIPRTFLGSSGKLWLIPAGDYMSPEYSRNLNKLKWELIFSEERRGVAFFQHLLARIEEELKPDTMIVDSRTGICEIAGICTQQLADEVVMLSSLSGEGIKMTKHIRELILNSKIAKELGKSIDVKTVVARVPKPDDLDEFKKYCCKLFEVDETKLFFLFSCPTLEQEEFLAVIDTNKEAELVSNYVQLFYGLDVELGSENIRAAAVQTINDLLLGPPISLEKPDRDIMGITALYPDPEVYRIAMRFYYMAKDNEKVMELGFKLLDLLPDDEETQRMLVNIYMGMETDTAEESGRPFIPLLEALWEKDKLRPEEALRYASFLELSEEYQQSFNVAFSLAFVGEIRPSHQDLSKIRQIVFRTAIQLGEYEDAMNILHDMPEEDLDVKSVDMLMKLYEETDRMKEAFDTAVRFFNRGFNVSLLERASHIAKKVNRLEDLEEVIKNSDTFRRFRSRYPARILADEMGSLGFARIADDLRFLAGQAIRDL